MWILTSWDDGHPSDLRIADLLAKHGLQGTFFIPINNSEGLPVLPANSIRELELSFEVGGHTRDHIYLNKISKLEIFTQICDGKRELEDIIGTALTGFCYPGGMVVPYAVETVQNAGFLYARTTENLRTDIGHDRWRIPTTFQFFPHNRDVYVRNFLRYGKFASRRKAFFSSLRYSDYLCRLREVALLCADQGSVFHLMGHSWEIDMLAIWQELDEFLGFLASLGGKSVTLNEIVSKTLLA